NIEFDADFRILRGDETRWLRAVARSVRDRHGQAIKMIGVNWDITDSRRAQERIARSEAQFRGAFEIAPNGMALVDGQGRWLKVNQALCDILGYSADELLALDFQSISDPEGLEEDFKYLDALLCRRAEEIQFEKYYIHKQGHRIPALLSASAVRDAQGELSFVVAHILDLTERRASEAALLAAKEAAEAANRAKGEFLANMSHEIRTPLNAMIGLTDLTLGTRLDARQRDYLEKVRQSSGALLDILNDILDYSKIEAGHVELASRQFQLRDLLDQLTALFQSTVEAKGLDLLYRVAPEVPRQLIGDPMRLGQVLNNLVGNAVKFTEQGRVQLDVSVIDEQDAGVKLRFCVQDTGIGIAAGTLEHLFQAFTQADGSITRRYGGTGLGLSISQRLVSMMGGRIMAESSEGEGSRFQFTVRFPLPDADWQRSGARPPGLAQSRILLVGKEPHTTRILSEILQSWHLPLTTVADCAEARQQIARTAEAGSPIDLMLLNATPCLDCRSCPAAEAPVSTSGLPHRTFGEPATPVILMVTHLEQTRLLERSSASTLPRFLTKPVTTSTLFDALASVTSSGPHRPTGTEPELQLDRNPLQGRCILVAEDNPVNQIVAEEMLKRFGARVLIADDGREAVELALQHNVDAVLMDLQMPEMDGFEATINIRTHKPMLPIIALTAAALERDRERCLSAGMNDHLGKPVSSAQLLTMLSHWPPPEPAFDSAPAQATAPAEDTPWTDPQALNELRRLIAHNDYVPPAILANLRRQAGPATQLVLSKIEQALARFDYDAAGRALDELPSLSSSSPAN
ncbi:response regulator, partial [Halochromatium sp.]